MNLRKDHVGREACYTTGTTTPESGATLYKLYMTSKQSGNTNPPDGAL